MDGLKVLYCRPRENIDQGLVNLGCMIWSALGELCGKRSALYQRQSVGEFNLSIKLLLSSEEHSG